MVGDLLLSEIAFRLSGALPPGSSVARTGGDEFAILLCDSSDNEDVCNVCNHILECVSQPRVHTEPENYPNT